MTAVVRRSRPEGSPWTREETVDWYQRARAKLGRPPTQQEIQPHLKTFIRVWGGDVGGLYRACGDEPYPVGRPRSA